MNSRIRRIVRDAQALPVASRDATLCAVALLRQRAKRRDLTGFEQAVLELLRADLRDAPIVELADLTLAATHALRTEYERTAAS